MKNPRVVATKNSETVLDFLSNVANEQINKDAAKTVLGLATKSNKVIRSGVGSENISQTKKNEIGNKTVEVVRKTAVSSLLDPKMVCGRH